jgi:hypothetical protein
VNPEEIALRLADTAIDQAAWLAGLRVKYGLRCLGQANPVDLGLPRWPGLPAGYSYFGLGPSVVSTDGLRWFVVPG